MTDNFWNEINTKYPTTSAEATSSSTDTEATSPSEERSSTNTFWSNLEDTYKQSDDETLMLSDLYNIGKAAAKGLVYGTVIGIPELVAKGGEFVSHHAARVVPGMKSMEEGFQTERRWVDEAADYWFGPKESRGGETDAEKLAFEVGSMFGPSAGTGIATNLGLRYMSRFSTLSKAISKSHDRGKFGERDKLIKAAKSLSNKIAWGSSNIVGAAFGLAASQDTVESAYKQAKILESQGKLEEAQEMRRKAEGWIPVGKGALEWIGETLGSKYLTKLARLDELPSDVAKSFKEKLFDLGKTLFVETTTEVGQNVGEGALEQLTGIRPEADYWKEGLDAILPTALFTLLTAGFFAGASKLQPKKVTPTPPPPPVGWTPTQEKEFKVWYQNWAKETGQNENPDDPYNQYDFRKAYLSGAFPTPDESGAFVWPKEYKYRSVPPELLPENLRKFLAATRPEIDKAMEEYEKEVKEKPPAELFEDEEVPVEAPMGEPTQAEPSPMPTDEMGNLTFSTNAESIKYGESVRGSEEAINEMQKLRRETLDNAKALREVKDNTKAVKEIKKADLLSRAIEVATHEEDFGKEELSVSKPKPEIPEFKISDDAVAFGKTATKEQIVKLQELEEETKKKVEVALKTKTYKGMREASELAFKVQLYREAHEVQTEPNRYATEIIKPGDVKTPRFKKWFGKSIVKKGDEPTQLYHATKHIFDAFDPSKGELGTHVGTEEQANAIAAQDKKSTTIAMYARVEHPLRLIDKSAWDAIFVIPQLVEKFGLNEQDLVEEMDDYVQRRLDETSLRDEGEIEDWRFQEEFIRKFITNLGYDSIVYLNRHEASNNDIDHTDKYRLSDAEYSKLDTEAKDSYILFNPNQAKSIFNIGTWSRETDKLSLSMAGAKGATQENLDKLSNAKSMKRNGISHEEIWQETGWWEIIPGQWSFEIDDSKVTYKVDIAAKKSWEGKLGDFIDHPGLFAAYPQLKNLRVAINLRPDQGLSGGFNPKNIGRSHKSAITLTIPKASDIKWLLHEVQHTIQHLEGFEPGGALGSEYANYEHSDVVPLMRKSSDLLKQAETSTDPSEKYKLEREAAAARYEATLKAEFAGYQSVVGEAEARLVIKRRLMSVKQRENTPPWITLEEMLKSEGILPEGKTAVDILRQSAQKGRPSQMTTGEDITDKDEVITELEALMEEELEGEPTKKKIKQAILPKKMLAAMPEHVAALEKAGVAVGDGPHRKMFFIARGEKVGLIYGPAPSNATIKRRTKSTIFGKKIITEYHLEIDGVDYKILNTPILPKSEKLKKAKLDELVKSFSHELEWYNHWIDYMEKLAQDKVPKEEVTKYLKIQCVLSAMSSPAGAQTTFGNVVRELEEYGSIQHKVPNVPPDSAKKINMIWAGLDGDIKTLGDFQAAYGMKIGAMVYSVLNPNTMEDSVVVDRHMARLWGHNVTFSAAFKVPKDLQKQITKDVVDLAKRSGYSIPAVQATLWFATGAGHKGMATHFEEAIRISPKKSLSRTLFSATTVPKQQVIHFNKTLYYTIRGAHMPKKLTIAERERLNTLRYRGTQGHLFHEPLTTEEQAELIQLTHKQEGDKPNPWSKGDVGHRNAVKTKDNYYMPLAHHYGPGVRRESYFGGQEPLLTTIYEGEIYDLDADRLGYKEVAWIRAKSDQKVLDGELTADQVYPNAITNVIYETGDFKGFATDLNGMMVVRTFNEVPVEQFPIDVEIVASSNVNGVMKLPQDITQLAEVAPDLLNDFEKRFRKEVQKYGVNISNISGGLIGSSNEDWEHDLIISLHGPIDAIKAALSDVVGLQNSQQAILLLRGDQVPNASWVSFTLRDNDLKKTQKTLEESGIKDVTLRDKKGDISVEILVSDLLDEAESKRLGEAIVKSYEAIGKDGSLQDTRTYAELLSEDATDLGFTQPGYKDSIIKHFGKEKGEKVYDEAKRKGAEWAGQARELADTILASHGIERSDTAESLDSSDLFREPQAEDLDAEGPVEEMMVGGLVAKITAKDVYYWQELAKFIEKAFAKSGLAQYPEVAKIVELQLSGLLHVDPNNLTQESLHAWATRYGKTDAEMAQMLRDKKVEINGSAQANVSRAIVKMALYSSDHKTLAGVEKTSFHEIYHILEALVSPKAIVDRMKKEWKMDKEDRADAFAEHMIAKGTKEETEIPSFVREFWDQVIKFLRYLNAYLTQNSELMQHYQLETIFDKLVAGKFTPHMGADYLVHKPSGTKVNPSLVREMQDTYNQGDDFRSVLDDAADAGKVEDAPEVVMPELQDLDIVPPPDPKPEDYVSSLPNALQTPELVELVEMLTGGKLPQVKAKLAESLRGYFVPKKGTIVVNAKTFEDPVLAAQVLAHEIGHLVDWLPDHLIKGGILSKIATLRQHMIDTLPYRPGAFYGPLTEADKKRLMDEAEMLLTLPPKERVKFITEYIDKMIPISSDDVLAIWNSIVDAKLLTPELYKYVAGLDSNAKRLIVAAVLKGQLAEELKVFVKPSGEKERVRTPVTVLTPAATKGDILKKYARLVDEEIRKRKLWVESEIRDELKVLSWKWRPWDPAQASKSYKRYRASAEELYADAVSVLFNNPAMLKAEAPKFYEAFFLWLENKPQVAMTFLEIQSLMRSGSLDRHRTDRLFSMFDEGNRVYGEAFKDRKNWGKKDKFMRDFIDSFHAILRDVRKVGEGNVPSYDNPRYKLEDMVYTMSEVEAFVTDLKTNVIVPLEKANLKWDREFGLMTFLRRVSFERATIANPLGWNAKLALEKLNAMKERELTPAQWVALKTALKNFHTLHEKYFLDKAEAAEVWDDKLMEVMRNREEYATFSIQHYLDEHHGKVAGKKIYQQIGTFNRITNPATATIMQDIAMIKAINKNIAVRTLVKFYQDYKTTLGIDIKPAEKKWNGKFQEIQPPPYGSDQGLIVYMHKGKAYGFYVPTEIADAVNERHGEESMAATFTRWTAVPFRRIFTELNYGFWPFNVARDLQRMYSNLPGWNPASMAKHWLASVKPAFRSVLAIPDAVVQERQRNHMLLTVAEMKDLEGIDTQMERLLAMYHLNPREYQNKIIKPFGHLLNWVHTKARLGEYYFTSVGRALERTTKLATASYLEDKFPGMPPEVVAHIVRTQGGSPDFLRAGNSYSIYNNILLFSNAAKEGWRGDIEAFAGHKQQFITKKILLAMLPKLIMFAALYGLFGDDLEKIFRKISEYDLTNYQILPIGLTKSGSAVYFRMPMDETSRLVGGVFWKILRAPEMGFANQTSALFDYMAGQAPSLNPFFGILWDTLDYASGQLPFDRFYGRPAMDELTFEAGGSRAHWKFAKYLMGKGGASIVYKFKSDNHVEVAQELESVLGFPIQSEVADFMVKLPEWPVASNILGRFLKVSNYGEREEFMRAKKKVRKGNANAILDAKEQAMNMVNGGFEPTVENFMKLGMKPDVFNNSFVAALVRKHGTLWYEELLSARTNEEKMAVIAQLSKMGQRYSDTPTTIRGEPTEPSKFPSLEVKKQVEGGK